MCFQSWSHPSLVIRSVCPRSTPWQSHRRQCVQHLPVLSQCWIWPNLGWTQRLPTSGLHLRSYPCWGPIVAHTQARYSTNSRCLRPWEPRAAQPGLTRFYHFLYPLWSHPGSRGCQDRSLRLGVPSKPRFHSSHRTFSCAPSGQSWHGALDSLWCGRRPPHPCRHPRHSRYSSGLRQWLLGWLLPAPVTGVKIREAP